MEKLVSILKAKGLTEDLARKLVMVKPGDEFGAEVYNRLPTILQNIIEPFDEDFKRDFVLMGVLPTSSALLFNTTFKYREGKIYYPNIYGLVIARAGSSKSLMMYGEEMYRDILSSGVLFKIPGDSSSAAFIKFLLQNEGRGVFLESEIDTATKGFDQKWGDHSDIYRLGFENETVSKFRVGDEQPMVLNNPRFGIALSGTPNQVGPLIKSYANGMFSRFFLYVHKGVNQYKKWKQSQNTEVYEAVKNTLSDLGDNLYDSQVNYSFEAKFKDEFIDLTDIVGQYWEERYDYDDDMRAVCRRGIVMAIKIAVVLSFIAELDSMENNAPFYVGIEYLEASLAMVSVSIANASEYIVKARKEQLIPQQRALYASLPQEDTFTTSRAKSIGSEFGMNPSSTQRSLEKMCEIGLLTKVSHGHYKVA